MNIKNCPHCKSKNLIFITIPQMNYQSWECKECNKGDGGSFASNDIKNQLLELIVDYAAYHECLCEYEQRGLSDNSWNETIEKTKQKINDIFLQIKETLRLL